MVSLLRIALVSVCLLVVPRFASAVAISIAPLNQNAIIGEHLGIDILVTDLDDGAAPSLGVFDIDLFFDPAIVSFVDVNWGNQLDLFGFGSVRAATPDIGFVNLFELSLDSADDLNALQAGGFLLATVLFQGIGVGTSDVALSINALGDADGVPLFASVGPQGLVTVAQTPEPSTIVLLLVGSAILWRSRMRPTRTSSSPSRCV